MSYKGDNAKNQAKRLLKHYFGLTIPLDGDNRAEIEEIVDCIVAAAVEDIKEAMPEKKDTTVFIDGINLSEEDIKKAEIKLDKIFEEVFGEKYKNEDRKCECWKCELSSTCPYKDKYQRLPRTAPGALGLCKKL